VPLRPRSADLRQKEEWPSFLASEDLRLLLFGGKGGVGKTTCAAAAAVRLASRRPDARFLLVSVDPAHSLKDCFAEDRPPVNLEVLELDAQAGLAEFQAKNGETLKEIARRGTFLDEEDIDRFVELSLPGLDELIAFLHISEWLEQAAYQTIVVDTAPSGHTLRLLAMPSLMREWLDAVDALLAKYRYMKRLFRGSYKPDAPDRLLLELTAATRRTEKLLRSTAACFVPVLLAEALSLQETARLIEELDGLGSRVGPLVVNRLLPQNDCANCQRGRAAERQLLSSHKGFLASRETWGLPLLPEEVRGLAALGALWESATPLDTREAEEADRGPEQTSAAAVPRVPKPAPLPEKTLSLLLFAGKGGVGKTTLSCATALRVNEPPHGRPVVLLSTDPAHSIGHCLSISVGPQKKELRPGLTALAPDAAAEWREWQRRYSDELEALLQKTLPSVDLTFDRQVMERLLSLCPPGMDEIIALTQITELLASHPEALIIVDTAPTGHLLRLLEMPELLHDWLNAFFSVLLKYRKVLRMPRLSDQLIALSKRLKSLRLLLRDPARARLVAVAIPTLLSYEETCDLLSACRRMGLGIDQLMINQCTEPTDCRLCSALVARETKVIAAFGEAAANIVTSTVYKGDPPVGIDAVASLGSSLFATPSQAQRRPRSEDGYTGAGGADHAL